MHGLLAGLAVAAFAAALVLSVPVYGGWLGWRRQRADSVDAAWRESRAGIDLEPLRRAQAISTCEAILAAGNERSSR